MVFRLHNRELDEKEGEERENGSLEKADEYFEHHEWHGKEVRGEIDGNGDDYLARQDITEEPERERYDAHQLADEFDDADSEADGIFEGILNELAAVLPETDGEDARYFDNEKGYDGENERHGEVGIRRAQKRVVMIFDGADARYEVQHVAHEDKEEYRHEKRKKFARHIAAFERLCDVVVDERDHRLHERLKLSGNHFELAAHEERHRDQNCDDYPAGDERVGDRNAEKFSELFRRDGNVNTFIHWR